MRRWRKRSVRKQWVIVAVAGQRSFVAGPFEPRRAKALVKSISRGLDPAATVEIADAL